MKVYVDANPTTIAYVTEDKRQSRLFRLQSPHTNNEAEYKAVIMAIKELSGHLEIYSDSQIVVKQLNFEYSIKEDRLRSLAESVHNLCHNRNISFNWIPRKENLAGKYLG